MATRKTAPRMTPTQIRCGLLREYARAIIGATEDYESKRTSLRTMLEDTDSLIKAMKGTTSREWATIATGQAAPEPDVQVEDDPDV